MYFSDEHLLHEAQHVDIRALLNRMTFTQSELDKARAWTDHHHEKFALCLDTMGVYTQQKYLEYCKGIPYSQYFSSST
jgi:hypothetical protein